MMSHRNELVDIIAILLHETERAFLIVIDEGDRRIWLPKSLVEYDDGTFTMPEWLAMEKGLI